MRAMSSAGNSNQPVDILSSDEEDAARAISAVAAASAASAADSREMTDAASREPMPTSKAGFKRHPRYVLEEQLGAREVMREKKVVGWFKGLKVYDRAGVRDCR